MIFSFVQNCPDCFHSHGKPLFRGIHEGEGAVVKYRIGQKFIRNSEDKTGAGSQHRNFEFFLHYTNPFK